MVPRFVKTAFTYIAPLLLVAVASLQLYRAHAYQQTPWKGGGFGMFSTVDKPDTRVVRTFVVTADGRDLEVPHPRQAERDIGRARVVPSQAALERIGDAILDSRWVWAAYDPTAAGSDRPRRAYGSGARPRLRQAAAAEPEPPPEALVPVAAARVELWRIGFDGERSVLTSRRQSAVTRRPATRERGRAADARACRQ